MAWNQQQKSQGGQQKQPPKSKLTVAFTKVEATTGEKEKITVEAELINAYDEKFARLKIDGKPLIIGGAPSTKTTHKKVTFIFPASPKTEKALLRVEVVGEGASDEIEISPKAILSATPGTQKTDVDLSIAISHPIGQEKEFDVTIVTLEVNEKVTISSTVPMELNQIDPPIPANQQSSQPATLFGLQSGDNKTLYLRFKFTGIETQLQIRQVSTGKIYKKWLVK